MTQVSEQAPSAASGFLHCTELEALVRPRYFTGQLLTADELNCEQAYIAAKQRLHNRFLHGTRGRIVTGLQIVLRENGQSVTVAAGYAIDYCGNDIVVPEAVTFDVSARIRAQANVLPYQRAIGTARNPAKITREMVVQADNQRQYWLTLAYDEQETRPTNALRQQVMVAVEVTKDCGCGKSGSRVSTARPRVPSVSSTMGAGSQNSSPLVCEMTRISEGYAIDIVAASGEIIDLSDARLTGDNRLILARITVKNGNIVQVEDAVAARQADTSTLAASSASAVSELQNAVVALQDALNALQAKITQLEASATPSATPGEAQSSPATSEEIQPSPLVAEMSGPATAEAKPPADEKA